MKLRKYNPALLLDSQLIEQFVARKNDLEILLQTIRNNIGSSSNQHIMFIGPRGMGKTTLVLRAMAEVRRKKTLNEAWYPIVMAEESYLVGSAAEFWLEAILRLSEDLKDRDLEKTHARLLEELDNKILYDKALDVLLDFADKQGKRLIVVAESFNMLLGEQIKDSEGWILRETLINEPRVMMVATATSHFDQIENIKQPMFELFAVRELLPLSLSDCLNIWELVTEKKDNERRIRPIEILTGGNPRLLIILSSFAANSSLKELIEDIIALIDDHTDYLKSNTESLPPLERKAFVALADIWSPATARDIAKVTRLSVNQASTQLTRLEKRGAVVVQRKEGRKKYYQLAERLYNIYHQLRRRGSQSSRVRTAVKFMIDYYEERELQFMVNTISTESLDLGPDEREDHFLALEHILKSFNESQIQKRLIASIHPGVFECSDFSSSLKMLQQESVLSAQKKWKQALEPIREFLKNAGFARHFTPDVIDFFIGAAAAGHAEECLEILSDSPSAEHLEPLVVALQKYLDKATNAPLEVYEVAKDIVVEINEAKGK
ncbi:AAA family ATPase [Desulfobacterales bacterium HSG16]|nr:AAA family ATPase [Desulfobacterales bacterium HSG16]